MYLFHCYLLSRTHILFSNLLQLVFYAYHFCPRRLFLSQPPVLCFEGITFLKLVTIWPSLNCLGTASLCWRTTLTSKPYQNHYTLSTHPLTHHYHLSYYPKAFGNLGLYIPLPHLTLTSKMGSPMYQVEMLCDLYTGFEPSQLSCLGSLVSKSIARRTDGRGSHLRQSIFLCKMTVSGELCCIALPFCCVVVALLSQHLFKWLFMQILGLVFGV